MTATFRVLAALALVVAAAAAVPGHQLASQLLAFSSSELRFLDITGAQISSHQLHAPVDTKWVTPSTRSSAGATGPVLVTIEGVVAGSSDVHVVVVDAARGAVLVDSKMEGDGFTLPLPSDAARKAVVDGESSAEIQGDDVVVSHSGVSKRVSMPGVQQLVWIASPSTSASGSPDLLMDMGMGMNSSMNNSMDMGMQRLNHTELMAKCGECMRMPCNMSYSYISMDGMGGMDHMDHMGGMGGMDMGGMDMNMSSSSSVDLGGNGVGVLCNNCSKCHMMPCMMEFELRTPSPAPMMMMDMAMMAGMRAEMDLMWVQMEDMWTQMSFMRVWFHGGISQRFLFNGWDISPNDGGAYFGAVVFIFGVAVLREYLNGVRQRLQSNLKQRGSQTTEDVDLDTAGGASKSSFAATSQTPFMLDSVFYGVSLTLGYLLMLSFMYFNVGWAVTVVLSSVVGHYATTQYFSRGAALSTEK